MSLVGMPLTFTLTFGTNGGPPQTYTLQPGSKNVVRIGRSPKNDIVVSLPGISNIHAELLISGSGGESGSMGLAIVDSSSNGTGLKLPGASIAKLKRGEETCVPDKSVIIMPMKVSTQSQQTPDSLRTCFEVELRRSESHLFVQPESEGASQGAQIASKIGPSTNKQFAVPETPKFVPAKGAQTSQCEGAPSTAGTPQSPSTSVAKVPPAKAGHASLAVALPFSVAPGLSFPLSPFAPPLWPGMPLRPVHPLTHPGAAGMLAFPRGPLLPGPPPAGPPPSMAAQEASSPAFRGDSRGNQSCGHDEGRRSHSGQGRSRSRYRTKDQAEQRENSKRSEHERGNTHHQSEASKRHRCEADTEHEERPVKTNACGKVKEPGHGPCDQRKGESIRDCSDSPVEEETREPRRQRCCEPEGGIDSSFSRDRDNLIAERGCEQGGQERKSGKETDWESTRDLDSACSTGRDCDSWRDTERRHARDKERESGRDQDPERARERHRDRDRDCARDKDRDPDRKRERDRDKSTGHRHCSPADDKKRTRSDSKEQRQKDRPGRRSRTPSSGRRRQTSFADAVPGLVPTKPLHDLGESATSHTEASNVSPALLARSKATLSAAAEDALPRTLTSPSAPNPPAEDDIAASAPIAPVPTARSSIPQPPPYASHLQSVRPTAETLQEQAVSASSSAPLVAGVSAKSPACVPGSTVDAAANPAAAVGATVVPLISADTAHDHPAIIATDGNMISPLQDGIRPREPPSEQGQHHHHQESAQPVQRQQPQHEELQHQLQQQASGLQPQLQSQPLPPQYQSKDQQQDKQQDRQDWQQIKQENQQQHQKQHQRMAVHEPQTVPGRISSTPVTSGATHPFEPGDEVEVHHQGIWYGGRVVSFARYGRLTVFMHGEGRVHEVDPISMRKAASPSSQPSGVRVPLPPKPQQKHEISGPVSDAVPDASGGAGFVQRPGSTQLALASSKGAPARPSPRGKATAWLPPIPPSQTAASFSGPTPKPIAEPHGRPAHADGISRLRAKAPTTILPCEFRGLPLPRGMAPPQSTPMAHTNPLLAPALPEALDHAASPEPTGAVGGGDVENPLLALARPKGPIPGMPS